METFDRQSGVASVAQLRELGISSHAVSRAKRAGLVVTMATRVVGLAGRVDEFHARAMAIQLTAGDRGFLSGPTAAKLMGLRRMPDQTIEFTTTEVHPITVPAWARLVRTSWGDDEERLVRADSLRVASSYRMLFGLASQLAERPFEQAAEDAWHLGLVDPVSADRYLSRIRGRGRTGVARFEKWLEKTEARTRPATTTLEQLLADLARRAGLPDPERQYPLRLATGVTIHLDLAWPSIRLGLEPGHSWWHGGDQRMRDDQDRDRSCAELGWLILRFDESVWQRRDAVVRQLRRVYADRVRWSA